MIWIEHDMQMVADLADRIHVLDYGRTLASGPADAVLKDEKVIAAYLGTKKHALAFFSLPHERSEWWGGWPTARSDGGRVGGLRLHSHAGIPKKTPHPDRLRFAPSIDPPHRTQPSLRRLRKLACDAGEG